MRSAERGLWVRILCGVCAALFAAFTFAAALSAALKFFVFDTARLARAIVTDEYVTLVMQSAKDRLAPESPYYGIPEEVLFAGLDRETVRAAALTAAQNELNVIFFAAEYESAKYPDKPFAEAIGAYFETLRAEDPDLEIRSDALEQISGECAALTEAYLNPIPQKLSDLAFSNPQIQKAIRLSQRVSDKFYACLAGMLLSLAFTILLAKKSAKERLFAFAAPFFIASGLFFCPVVIALSGADLSGIVLAESVLKTFLESAFLQIKTPVILFAWLWFAPAVVTLIVSIVLKTCEPEAETEE